VATRFSPAAVSRGTPMTWDIGIPLYAIGLNDRRGDARGF
jgi:hypothetical protein